ncbi:retrotransposon protein, putative, ty1-copia subclass [Tanacetum coccineum]
MPRTTGIMPTKIELTLEQSQQGVSNDVLVTWLIANIEDEHHGTSVQEQNPSAISGFLSTEIVHLSWSTPRYLLTSHLKLLILNRWQSAPASDLKAVNKSPMQYHCDIYQNIRVILMYSNWKMEISAESGIKLRSCESLTPGALSLYLGNGQHAAVEAIESYDLCLPSGLVIVLHNCHYATSITRRVISVSRLYDDGFINRFKNDNSISISKDNLIYFNAILRDDIYEIILSDSNTNDSSMYAIRNKRDQLSLDSSLLWHYHLRHINKKRIKKLQHDGLLNSIVSKSFEKYVPCLSGKMAQKPYSHKVERAKDLLGLIHTDVYGPFRIVSRQGASYFITFTDDFSRYGYVYLLKHKHEVFETFKVFQKEVENQLRKTIKSLRSDCRGEYMSQEFLDNLKEHGIIAHHTPP